jgi:hypothetical protein
MFVQRRGLDRCDIAAGVPELSAEAMMLLGCVGLGYAGYPRSRRRED